MVGIRHRQDDVFEDAIALIASCISHLKMEFEWNMNVHKEVCCLDLPVQSKIVEEAVSSS